MQVRGPAAAAGWAEQAVLVPRSGASQRSWVLELSGPEVK